MDHRPRRQSELAKKSQSSKESFDAAKKMYKQELEAKRNAQVRVNDEEKDLEILDIEQGEKDATETAAHVEEVTERKAEEKEESNEAHEPTPSPGEGR